MHLWSSHLFTSFSCLDFILKYDGEDMEMLVHGNSLSSLAQNKFLKGAFLKGFNSGQCKPYQKCVWAGKRLKQNQHWKTWIRNFTMYTMKLSQGIYNMSVIFDVFCMNFRFIYSLLIAVFAACWSLSKQRYLRKESKDSQGTTTSISTVNTTQGITQTCIVKSFQPSDISHFWTRYAA